MLRLNSTTRAILGRPNFTCSGIAKKLKSLGLYDVAPKAEDEQAVAIHFLLSQYEKHGDNWRKEAYKILSKDGS